MIPASHLSNRLSLPALGLILAAIILALILGVVTWRNLDREERLMESFLREEGLTLIRAFEAGARTSMMMNWEGNSLATLVRETARTESVAYVAIADASGQLLTAAGERRSSDDILPVAQVLAKEQPRTRQTKDGAGRSVFEVATEFNPVLPEGAGREGMMGRWQRWCGMGCAPGEPVGRRAIFVGLYTGEFEAARDEDVRQSLLMGALLLLLGSTGFYFLFLSQQTRVAKTTLANMELYTRNVIDSMPAGLITLDNQGRIVSLNDKARGIFGQQGEAAEGSPLEALTGAERCEIAPLVREGREFVERPMECRRPSGESIPVKVSASRLTDRDGEPLGTVLVVRDLREIKAMEEALERSRRHAALGRMAAGIAHEIRNPLGTLRGFAQYFAKFGKKDPHAGEYAELMVGEVDRLNRTISALLQFARPREPEPEEIDLGGLLRRTARLLQDDLAARNLTFQLDPPAGTVTFTADSDLLTQVLINLLQNAQAATEAGGEIRLGASAQDVEIRFWVEDTGKGMTPEERSRMFDPFFTTRKTGTGLGLAMVHQIVEQHGGRIEVESAPEKGTRVEVILPREPAQRKEIRSPA
ncbi:sensor histidine kinase PilS, PAS domain-containing [Desulfuromonas sp. DDH964]|uniref:two-component system sensor histidine kinase NtrB n=1 Tax=Desulfuromonas sp. DDH964 TaxID=1823759 RepID=UPI00078DB869|nr:ATP-binding protein [Desulfuromonas sp. DDH964]AMV70589.1 sensor histidine kinase PilS, PAS domain-containing [Desulfuromonas sp. DDH964]